MTQAMNSILIVAALALLGACGAGNGSVSDEERQLENATAGSSPKKADTERASPGKPTAPISINYEVVGTAIVGQPVSVNLQISSTDASRPVRMQYRANDMSSFVFSEAQPEEVEIGTVRGGEFASEQVTVIPQREGRIFLNVSASVETPQGTMFRSLAVPIQVGSAPEPATVNGELKETADGETVISMPAKEQ